MFAVLNVELFAVLYTVIQLIVVTDYGCVFYSINNNINSYY